MRKFLLSIALSTGCVAVVSAQSVYNYFDAADVDADGWLWFDTQEKIDKYVGWGSKYKIQLQTATYEDEDYNFPEPYCDPEAEGWNEGGELGGEGAVTGAIILPAGTTTNGSDDPNGGGIMLQLPDVAEFDLFLSTSDAPICVGLFGANGWVEPIDCQTLQIYMKLGIWINRPLANDTQYEWNNIQNVKNEATGFTLTKNSKSTILVRNNIKRELYVQGIKVLTYTASAGVGSLIAQDGLNLRFDGKQVTADETASFELYSISGAKVMDGIGESISMSHLVSGAYIVKARSLNATQTLKVVL